MSEQLLTLGELAAHLKMNRTHLAKKVRDNGAFPRLNTNPGGKRARYRFYLSQVETYMKEQGEIGKGGTPPASTAQSQSQPQSGEDVDPLIRIS